MVRRVEPLLTSDSEAEAREFGTGPTRCSERLARSGCAGRHIGCVLVGIGLLSCVVAVLGLKGDFKSGRATGAPPWSTDPEDKYVRPESTPEWERPRPVQAPTTVYGRESAPATTATATAQEAEIDANPWHIEVDEKGQWWSEDSRTAGTNATNGLPRINGTSANGTTNGTRANGIGATPRVPVEAKPESDPLPTPMPTPVPTRKAISLTCPMYGYTGRHWGVDMCFCNKAQNPTCVKQTCHCYHEGCGVEGNGINVSKEFVTFYSFPNAQGCEERSRVLTIPSSYFATCQDLLHKCGANSPKLLAQMLVAGFHRYREPIGNVSVMQCIHKAWSVSVHWLHLHTFCEQGVADGMPNRQRAYCHAMSNVTEAPAIAETMVQWMRMAEF